MLLRFLKEALVLHKLCFGPQKEGQEFGDFLPKLGLRLGNPPCVTEEVREVMVGSHSPSEFVEIAVCIPLHKAKLACGCQVDYSLSEACGAKHLHRLMRTSLEDLHRSVRSIDLWNTGCLPPIIVSAAVPLCSY